MSATAEGLTPEQKYSKDGDFKEPVLICDSCAKVQLKTTVNKLGKCPGCGYTRFRNVLVINEDNMTTIKKWQEEGKIDPDWLTLYAPVEETA